MSNPYVLIISYGEDSEKADRALLFHIKYDAINFVRAEARAIYINNGFNIDKIDVLMRSIDLYLTTRGVWHNNIDGTTYKIMESEQSLYD